MKIIQWEDITEEISRDSILALPTDTIPGVFCNATNSVTIDRMFKMKQRDAKKATAIFLHSTAQLSEFTELREEEIEKLSYILPGNFTIITVAKKGCNVSGELLTNAEDGRKLIGIRIPRHRCLLNALERISFPLTGTSINISGFEPMTNIGTKMNNSIAEYIDYMVDDNSGVAGNVSTVFMVIDGKITIVRQGAAEAPKELPILN